MSAATLIVDAHLDLAMNALEWNRDLTRPLDEVRRREADWTDKVDRGAGVVTLPEMRKGRIGLCVATLIGRYVALDNPLPGWHSPAQAWATTQGQLAWYRVMEREGQLRMIRDRAGLRRHLDEWFAEPETTPLGFILSLEGADSILTPRDLEQSYADGLRALGPAHYGPGRYAPGTGTNDPLEPAARELLAEMDRLGMVLDATHLTDRGFWQALELFAGPVWASPSNCRQLVPDERQFNDDQLRALIERGAVIGMAFDAWMMVPGWVRGESTPAEKGVRIETIGDHIDHVCQLAGNGRHVGLGTDLDGGYGREQCPSDLNSIADLQQLVGILQRRGYPAADIAAIMHGNWIRRFEESLDP